MTTYCGNLGLNSLLLPPHSYIYTSIFQTLFSSWPFHHLRSHNYSMLTLLSSCIIHTEPYANLWFTWKIMLFVLNLKLPHFSFGWSVISFLLADLLYHIPLCEYNQFLLPLFWWWVLGCSKGFALVNNAAYKCARMCLFLSVCKSFSLVST